MALIAYVLANIAAIAAIGFSGINVFELAGVGPRQLFVLTVAQDLTLGLSLVLLLRVWPRLRLADLGLRVPPALGRGLTTLASCEHFRVTRVRSASATEPRNARDSFRLVLPIAPTVWGPVTLTPGDLALCPASVELPDPIGEWLEIEA